MNHLILSPIDNITVMPLTTTEIYFDHHFKTKVFKCNGNNGRFSFKQMCFHTLCLFYSGMLPEAVIPPSDEHSYAQWLINQDRTIKKAQGDHKNTTSKSQGQFINEYLRGMLLLMFVYCLLIFFIL